MSTDDPWITPTPDTAPFFDGARDGVLRLQRCATCETWMYPLRERCQNCGGTELTWQDASGAGTVFSHAGLARVYHPRHAERLPLTIAWIDLAEGVRMPSNVVGCSRDQIRVGAPVQVAFETDPAGTTYPVFRLAD